MVNVGEWWKTCMFSVFGFSIIIKIMDLTINIYYKKSGDFASISGKIEENRGFEMKHGIKHLLE